MKFVCLNLWLAEVCTDDANDNDARWTKHDWKKALWLINEPKMSE